MHISKKYLKTVIAVALVSGGLSSSAQVTWPVITKQTKPWARWWWQGSAVNKKDLTWNMESYHKAGLGGLELTAIYGVKGYESQFIPYLSPQWVGMLKYTLSEAKRLDMGIDMANATGWPFGGPWVSSEDASKELFWKTFDVKGGQPLAEKVIFIQQPLVRADGEEPKITDLVEPIGKNKNLQKMALDQVRFEKRIPLSTLVAYDGKGQAINLTAKVDAEGNLNWTAPAGDWKLYALFQGWHGKMVERAAPGGEGFVIDHFSKPAIHHYLDRFDQAFAGQNVNGIRAFFNDSYEVDDSQGQSNITPLFFDEFMKWRGYDLRDHLPALFGEDSNKETNSRVLCDYRETISDLVLNNFTTPWHDWAKSRGSLIRNQSHGSPSNILDLYAAIDIPETEGIDVLRYKFATSAAHVTGKPLASSESATWLNDHFLSSLGNVKQAIDKYFIGGVNHVFYHGISYSPPSAPWPGWLFYAAVHFNQTNPFWSDFSTLNNYIARCQSFLQQGNPDDDVLVYYPLFDSFSTPGRGLLKHYDAMFPEFSGSGFEEASKEMLKKGYSFDYISDKQIKNIPVNGGIVTGGITYQSILLPDCRNIPLATFNHIINLAKAGATIIAYKNLPSQVPGLGMLAEREKSFNDLIASLHFIDGGNGIKSAVVGKGHILMGDNIEQLLNAAKVRRESMVDNGLQFSRRNYKNGKCYFIANKDDKEVNGWVNLTAQASSVVIFDPMLKKFGLAKIKKTANKQTAVYLQLLPGESCIVQTSPTVINGAGYHYYQRAAKPVAITGTWTVKFVSGGPTLPRPLKTDSLKSWTVLGGDDAKAFSGTASYTIDFNKPKGNAVAWQLDLGKVYESADVYLNGNKLGTLIGPEYVINLPAAWLKPVNHLEVKVSNLMANRIIDMEKKNIPYKIFYNTNFPAHSRDDRGPDGLFTAINWQPKPSGIVGTVKLIPLKLLSPQ